MITLRSVSILAVPVAFGLLTLAENCKSVGADDVKQ
jgi:hypothetical protein